MTEREQHNKYHNDRQLSGVPLIQIRQEGQHQRAPGNISGVGHPLQRSGVKDEERIRDWRFSTHARGSTMGIASFSQAIGLSATFEARVTVFNCLARNYST